MIEINGRCFCENCFEPTKEATCRSCGFNASNSAYDPTMLLPGSVLLNRYVVGRVEGRGGFGITYLAYDALTCKKIAMKEYYPYGLALRTSGSSIVSVASEDSVEAFKLGAEKFYNEAKLVSKFNGNPNVVSVYDCFYENATVYMTMEFLRGHTLKDHIRDYGILSAPQTVFVAKKLTNALIVAHSASVLHRDISPNNIVLCDDGNIKLIDFGAARQVVSEHSQNFSLILKPGFAPPEQYKKKGNQGPWSDVYSLGTTLYYSLTGDIPEDPTTRFDDDDTFKENLFDIHPDLWEIITKATKLRIEERYADAYELKKALELVPITPEPIIAYDGSSYENTESAHGSAGNSADMTVSIRTRQPKTSFFRRHRRTIIEIICGLLAAAIIIPLAVKVYKPAVTANTSVPGDTSVPGSTESAVFGDILNLDNEGFNKPLYSCLSGNDKLLYSCIFDGLRTSKEVIEIPSYVYSVSMVSDIFDDVLNDNPSLIHTRGYTVEYIDNNGNKEPDSDENVIAIKPIYNEVAPDAMNDYIAKTLSETDLDDKEPIEFLRVIHDKLIDETDLVARNSTSTSSTAYAALIEHSADDLGIARAMCEYTQRLGYFSFVVNVKIADSLDTAAVRIKIDEEWFNINIIADAITNVNNILKMPLAEDGQISHMWFFIGDFYQDASGLFKYVRNFDEKYSAVFPTPKGLTVSDGETVVPIVNYYIQKYLQEIYYYAVNTNNIYSVILEESKACLDSGKDTVSLYMLASEADDLWDVMQDSYIADLKRKYDITISGFDVKFFGDQVILTIH